MFLLLLPFFYCSFAFIVQLSPAPCNEKIPPGKVPAGRWSVNGDYSNSSTINLLSLYFIDTSSNFKLFFRSIIVFFSFFLCNGVKTGSQSRSWPAFAQSRQSALLYFQGSALPMKNAFRECQKCFGKSDFVLRSLPILLDIFVREKEHESHSLNQQLTQQERKPHAVQTKSDRKDQNKRRNYNARFQY